MRKHGQTEGHLYQWSLPGQFPGLLVHCISMLTYSLQGDSVMHQSEDGKTASASKLELAATPAHVCDECMFSLDCTKEAI